MNATETHQLTSIDSLTVESSDPAAAARFYADAFGITTPIRTAASDAATSGFRGFTISLVTSQPANVRALFDAAVAAGASVLKPVSASLWGVGGVVQAPDGAVVNLATSTKKDAEPAARSFDSIVLLLGVDDVRASKAFYVDRGLAVNKSFGSYVDFAMPAGTIGFGLYKRKALAKTSGIAEAGGGSHRLTINAADASFTDPDGFAWSPSAS